MHWQDRLKLTQLTRRFRNKGSELRMEKKKDREKRRNLGTVTDLQRSAALPCPRVRPPNARDPCRVSARKCHLPLSAGDSDVPAKIRERRKRREIVRGRAPSDGGGRFCARFPFFSPLFFLWVTTSPMMLTSRGNEASIERPLRRPAGGRTAVEE